MSQISTETIGEEWVAFSDIETPVQDTNYYIQNRGAGALLACEADSKPSDENNDGIVVPPNKVLIYKLGSQNLYLKAIGYGGCTINVSDNG